MGGAAARPPGIARVPARAYPVAGAAGPRLRGLAPHRGLGGARWPERGRGHERAPAAA